ncbi:MAG: hypothetical protein KBS40_06245 [Bacteroidales bacterium]|nr:hypothetical protein [Bacteroidales bacterium]
MPVILGTSCRSFSAAFYEQRASIPAFLHYLFMEFSATYPSGGRGGMAETATPPYRHYLSMAVSSLYIVHL